RSETGEQIRARAVEQKVGVVLRPHDVETQLDRMLALGPGEAIGELESILAGVGARIIGHGTEVVLTRDVDAEETDARDAQRIARIIELLVFEPTKSEFIDHASGRNRRPGKPSILGANGGIRVVADALVVIQHARRLEAVRRDPAQHIQTGAERMAL